MLIRHLHESVGLPLLTSDGGAVALADPADVITDEFPLLMARQAREYYFWCPEIGPVRKLGDAPAPRDAHEAVVLHVSRESHPDNWRDLIDLSRTPVISWRRPVWYRPDQACIVAGGLGAMTAKVKEYPEELRRLHRSIDRWLRKPAVKVNPFEHCGRTPVPQPRNLSAFWVATWPQAKKWVDGGGELWPWDG